MLRDVNFACRIHPAAQSDIGEQQWVTGFHNELSLCVKCCRMVDSVPRWQLSLSGPIQSDHLIADCDDTAFGEGTLTWQDPVHSWKAGPGEVMTVENKQNLIFRLGSHGFGNSAFSPNCFTALC